VAPASYAGVQYDVRLRDPGLYNARLHDACLHDVHVHHSSLLHDLCIAGGDGPRGHGHKYDSCRDDNWDRSPYLYADDADCPEQSYCCRHGPRGHGPSRDPIRGSDTGPDRIKRDPRSGARATGHDSSTAADLEAVGRDIGNHAKHPQIIRGDVLE